MIAAGVSAAGSLAGGMMAMSQGNYESKIAKQNSDLAIEQARDSIDRGRDERKQFFRQAGQLKGQQSAAIAANGIDVGYGSALRTQQDTAQLLDEDADSLYDNIHERTQGFVINAMNFAAEAKAAKYRGKQAMIGSVFEAASSLAGGASQMSLNKAKRGGKPS